MLSTLHFAMAQGIYVDNSGNRTVVGWQCPSSMSTTYTPCRWTQAGAAVQLNTLNSFGGQALGIG
jgi:hypothetical protein